MTRMGSMAKAISASRLGGIALAGAIGLSLAGCGGDDEEDAATPEETVSAFFAATVEEDPEALCATLSEATAQSAAEDEDSETCEEGIEKSFASGDAEDTLAAIDGAEVGAATIDGETATVVVTSSEGQEGEIGLSMEDGNWKIELEE